jgi:glucokinase
VTGSLYLGVDLGRSTRAAVVDDGGNILLQDREPTRLDEGGRALVDGLIDFVRRVVAGAGNAMPIAAIGVGVPGLVDRATHRVAALPNLADISGVDLHADLARATGLPVVLDNDANTAAYGEWRCGAARGARDAIFITIGTGIGAGLIQDGQLHRGASGFAGEFGHFKVGVDGLECGCGNSGCLETVASGPNIVRRTRELLFDDPRSALSPLAAKTAGRLTCENVVEAALSDDAFARSVLSETAAYLGMAVANVVNLLNVELVVLGGPVMASNQYLLDRVREEALRRAFTPSYAACRVVAGELGADAGVIGAAMLARDTASAA